MQSQKTQARAARGPELAPAPSPHSEGWSGAGRLHSVTLPRARRRIPAVSWLWSDPRRWFAAVFLSVPVACVLDVELSLTQSQQWVMAAIAWLVVIGGLLELPRRQQLALICFLPLITIAEFGLSHGLGWYTYRLENIPPWIPPAHGIVFLTAIRAIDTQGVSTRVLAWSAGSAQAAYCLVSLVVRDDHLGALFGVIYLIGMVVLPDAGKRFYAMLGLLVAYLEVVGTMLGAWTWAPSLFGLGEANPPSGAVGGYSLVDGAAFLVVALGLWVAARLRDRRPGASRSEPAPSGHERPQPGHGAA